MFPAQRTEGANANPLANVAVAASAAKTLHASQDRARGTGAFRLKLRRQYSTADASWEESTVSSRLSLSLLRDRWVLALRVVAVTLTVCACPASTPAYQLLDRLRLPEKELSAHCEH